METLWWILALIIAINVHFIRQLWMARDDRRIEPKENEEMEMKKNE